MKYAGDTFIIAKDEHEKLFDAKPTLVKLKMLTEYKGLDSSLYDMIAKEKQLLTIQAINTFTQDHEMCDLFRELKSMNIKLCCASNSVYETVKMSLLRLGLMDYIDYFVSNEDVSRGKPHPEMYYKCMSRFECSPSNTIIVEDSPVGLCAARKTGACVIPVKSRKCINRGLLIKHIHHLQYQK
jgi:HAD superfamily hydrolase (TIGR01509 family)